VRRPAILIAALGILIGGCGGDDEGSERSRTATVKANGTLRVVAEEYSFDPARALVQGAGRLTVTLANKGSLAHNLKPVKDGRQVGGTPAFPGGQTESAVVNLEHGRYEMVCTVGDHAELGMTGELEVR
jgi:plastocyanin